MSVGTSLAGGTMGDLATALVERGLEAQLAVEVEALLQRNEFEGPDYLNTTTAEIDDALEHEDSLMFRFGRAVIKHDDLQIMAHLGQSITAAAGVGFFAGQTPASAICGAIAGMVVAGLRLANQFRRKAAVLEPDQYVILCILHARPLAADELQALLDARDPDFWTLDRVNAELARLKAVRLRDGHVVALVAESDGRWGTCGI